MAKLLSPQPATDEKLVEAIGDYEEEYRALQALTGNEELLSEEFKITAIRGLSMNRSK